MSVLQLAQLLPPDDATAVAVGPLIGVAGGLAVTRSRSPRTSRALDALEVAFVALALALPMWSLRLPEVLNAAAAMLVLIGPGFVIGRELRTLANAHRRAAWPVAVAAMLGASVATFAAGFAWSTIGVGPTSLLTATTLVVSLAGIGLGRSLRDGDVEPRQADGSSLGLGARWWSEGMARRIRASVRAARSAVASASMGFVLTGAVVLFTRILEPYVGASLLAEGALAAVPLAGVANGMMAVGLHTSLRGRRSGSAYAHPESALIALLACAPLALVASLVAYGGLEWFVPGAVRALGGIGSATRAAVLVLGVVCAMLLPISVVAGASFALDLERRPAFFDPFVRVLAAATGGSLVAGDLVPALLGTIGMRTAFLVLMVGGAGAAFVVALLDVLPKRTEDSEAAAGAMRTSARPLAPASILLAVAAIGVFLVPTDLFRRPFEARYGALLSFDEEQRDTIVVTDDPEQGRMLRYGDGRPAGSAGADPEDRFDAQVPMLLHPRPRRVLQIGLGTGSSISSVLQHPIESADVIEPSAAIAEYANLFEESNQGVLGDERLRVHIADPRSWLADHDATWDVIRIDLPDLHVAGAAGFYTRDLLVLVRERLAPGGILSLRLNLVSTPDAALPSILRTILDVFPHVTIWHGPLRYAWVINASEEPRPPDPALLRAKLADPDVEAELASLQAGDPATILGFFVMGTEDARLLAGQAPPITIERPRVDAIATLSPDSFYGLGSVASDTALANLTDPSATESVSVRLLFGKIQASMARKRPIDPR